MVSLGRVLAVTASLESKAKSSVTAGLSRITPRFLFGSSIQDCTRATPEEFSVIVYCPVEGAATVPSTVVPLSAVPWAPGTSQLCPVEYTFQVAWLWVQSCFRAWRL